MYSREPLRRIIRLFVPVQSLSLGGLWALRGTLSGSCRDRGAGHQDVRQASLDDGVPRSDLMRGWGDAKTPRRSTWNSSGEQNASLSPLFSGPWQLTPRVNWMKRFDSHEKRTRLVTQLALEQCIGRIYRRRGRTRAFMRFCRADLGLYADCPGQHPQRSALKGIESRVGPRWELDLRSGSPSQRLRSTL